MTDPTRLLIRYPTKDNPSGYVEINEAAAAQIVGLTDVLARIAALEAHSHTHSGYSSVITTTEPAPVAAAQPDAPPADGVASYYMPCGICGVGIMRGNNGWPIEYHDCKPVPAAKLDACRKELSEAQAMVTHSYEAEQRALDELDRALADLREAKLDAERAKAQRNGERAHADLARRQADKLAALLREARRGLAWVTIHNMPEVGQIIGRIDAALAEYGLGSGELLDSEPSTGEKP